MMPALIPGVVLFAELAVKAAARRDEEWEWSARKRLAIWPFGFCLGGTARESLVSAVRMYRWERLKMRNPAEHARRSAELQAELSALLAELERRRGE